MILNPGVDCYWVEEHPKACSIISTTTRISRFRRPHGTSTWRLKIDLTELGPAELWTSAPREIVLVRTLWFFWWNARADWPSFCLIIEICKISVNYLINQSKVSFPSFAQNRGLSFGDLPAGRHFAFVSQWKSQKVVLCSAKITIEIHG